MTPYFTQDLTPVFDSAIGAAGIRADAYEAWLGKTPAVRGALHASKQSNALPMFNLPHRQDDLAGIQMIADRIRADYDRLVVLGTGGSSLGGKTLVDLKQHRFAPPRVLFLDNVDPHSIAAYLEHADLKRTAFLAVSKSGTTVETVSQASVMMNHVKHRCGEGALAKQFFILTMPGDSPMRAMGQTIGATLIDHDPNVGGRFSAFSPVGLIPAAVAGLNIAALRSGAASVIEDSFSGSALCEASKGAAVNAAMMEAGRTISVLMPYGDRLASLGMWYRQTWAESVGKEGKGSTPIRALGTVDQHSQLQLYLDGPKDKFVTMLMLDNNGKGPAIEVDREAYPSLSYLTGKTLGDVMEAEQIATAETLTRNFVPLRILRIPLLNEESLGALLMHYMLETIMTAGLLGINAFDQPAVEEGKRLAREYLARQGA